MCGYIPRDEITQKQLDDLNRQKALNRKKCETIARVQIEALRKAARTGGLLGDGGLSCKTCGAESQSELTDLCNDCIANLVPVTEKIHGTPISPALEYKLSMIERRHREFRAKSILNAIGFGVLSIVTIGMIFVWIRILF